MTKETQTIDCLEFKRQAQAEIYEDIKDLTHNQQAEYFRKRAESGALGEWWKTIKASASATQAKAE